MPTQMTHEEVMAKWLELRNIDDRIISDGPGNYRFNLWVGELRKFFREVFGPRSRAERYFPFRIDYEGTSDMERLLYSAGDPDYLYKKHHQGILKMLDAFQGIGELLNKLPDSEFGQMPIQQEPPREVAPDPMQRVLRIFDRFHQVARQLQHRRENRPTLTIMNEYDVQDLLHALLRVDFEDVRDEETLPSTGGIRPRIDFVLVDERIAIEVKMTRQGLNDKKVTSELAEDILTYKAHSGCDRLVCFVYDPEGHIRNPASLAALGQRSSTPELEVIVVVRPQ